MAQEDARSGLSPSRLSALSVVVFAGPLSLGRLAAAERVKPPTMTTIVDGLERDGLVQRRPDPADARAVRVTATAKGTRLLQQARARRIAALTGLLDPLSDEQVAAVAEAAELLERALQNAAQ